MVDTADPVLERIIAMVVERVDPQQIILFGSRARGEARPDSDYDLLIVEDERRPGRGARIDALYRAMCQVDGAPAEFLLHSPEELARWAYSRAHVLGNAQREGRVVYRRP